MRQYVKPILGILLIVLAVFFMIYWEKEGRQRFTTTEVYVASKNIAEGEAITAEMIKKNRVLNHNLALGVKLGNEETEILGKTVTRDVYINSQITEDIFVSEKTEKDYLSPIVIESKWIASLSQSIRNGDYVELYTEHGEYIGVYRVGFARSREGNVIYELSGNNMEDIWKRGNASGIIESLELMSTATEYFRLKDIVEEKAIRFVIIQKRGKE